MTGILDFFGKILGAVLFGINSVLMGIGSFFSKMFGGGSNTDPVNTDAVVAGNTAAAAPSNAPARRPLTGITLNKDNIATIAGAVKGAHGFDHTASAAWIDAQMKWDIWQEQLSKIDQDKADIVHAASNKNAQWVKDGLQVLDGHADDIRKRLPPDDSLSFKNHEKAILSFAGHNPRDKSVTPESVFTQDKNGQLQVKVPERGDVDIIAGENYTYKIRVRPKWNEIPALANYKLKGPDWKGHAPFAPVEITVPEWVLDKQQVVFNTAEDGQNEFRTKGRKIKDLALIIKGDANIRNEGVEAFVNDEYLAPYKPKPAPVVAPAPVAAAPSHPSPVHQEVAQARKTHSNTGNYNNSSHRSPYAGRVEVAEPVFFGWIDPRYAGKTWMR